MAGLKRVFHIFLLYILTLIYSSSGVQRQSVVANTKHGTVEGFSIPSMYSYYDKKRINVFLGIPYARMLNQFSNWRKDFRFSKPLEPEWGGIWDATYYRPACPQHAWLVKETVPNFSSVNVSEDCLYLNVFAPNYTNDPTSNSGNLYPVMVFIHGGGYILGASQQFPGVLLAERNMVVVTFNYRLGPLGFLSTDDANSPGNYGMFDQVRVLEWVRDNIERFRGNPRLVTIFGQSTGASSVGLHLLSPRAENLFHRAIMQSGSDRCQWSYINGSSAKNYAKDLAWELGCPTDDMFRLVQCIQYRRTADEIVNASARVATKGGDVGTPWGPTVDGHIRGAFYSFLTDTPKSLRDAGLFKKIRIMVGMNKDDGSMFVPNLKTLDKGISPTEFGNIANEFLRKRSVEDIGTAMDALVYQYTYWPQPKLYNYTRQMITDMMSDYMFGTGIDEVLKLHAPHNTTYMYVFKYFSWNDYLPFWRGVAHGQELQYIFGFPFFNETYQEIFGLFPRQRYDYADRNMSEYMMSLWTNFSASGEPTPSLFYPRDFKNSTWAEFNLFNLSYYEIGNSSRNLSNYRQNEYGFWRSYFPSMWVKPKSEKPLSQVEEDKPKYQIATWSLSALSVVLIILVLSLCIAVYRRRPKDY